MGWREVAGRAHFLRGGRAGSKARPLDQTAGNERNSDESCNDEQCQGQDRNESAPFAAETDPREHDHQHAEYDQSGPGRRRQARRDASGQAQPAELARSAMDQQRHGECHRHAGGQAGVVGIDESAAKAKREPVGRQDAEIAQHRRSENDRAAKNQHYEQALQKPLGPRSLQHRTAADHGRDEHAKMEKVVLQAPGPVRSLGFVVQHGGADCQIGRYPGEQQYAGRAAERPSNGGEGTRPPPGNHAPDANQAQQQGARRHGCASHEDLDLRRFPKMQIPQVDQGQDCQRPERRSSQRVAERLAAVLVGQISGTHGPTSSRYRDTSSIPTICVCGSIWKVNMRSSAACSRAAGTVG